MEVKRLTNECVEWIKRWFDKNGSNSLAVIGISGGKDSSVVAGLCVKALGKDRVIGVKIPDGVQSDINDSNRIIDFLGIKSYEVNIGKQTEDMKTQLDNLGLVRNSVINSNMPPRLRMNVLYSVSQCVNGRVANTCNLSEDYIGWSTKWGDSVGDFSPISKLTASEVVAIGRYLELPLDLVEKTPSDGLCGLTDEEKFGFSYKELDTYIRTGVEGEHAEKIKSMHNNPNTKKKLYGIDAFEPNL